MEEVKEVAVWQRCKSPCFGLMDEQQCFENDVLQIGLLVISRMYAYIKVNVGLKKIME